MTQLSTQKPKIIRITTVPISMNKILSGQLKYLNQFYEIVGVSDYVEKDFKEIETREGIRMIAVSMVRTIDLIKDMQALIRLVKVFKQERPDIVHTHTPKAGLLGMIAAKWVGVPIRLHTVGGMPLMEAKGLKLWILCQTEKLTYALAHKIYPNSKGLADFIIKQQFTTLGKIKVIANGSSNGVNTDFYRRDFQDSDKKTKELRDRLGFKEDDFIFFFLGRIAKEKGISELLESFNELKKNYPTNSIKLLLVGTFEKDNGPVSQQIINEIENNADIVFPGRTDDVRLYLGMVDALVLPTYREGFPNVLLQAGAMSVPVIATDINGCNEIISHNKNGLLVIPKDANDLYEKMKYLYNNPDKRQEFGHKIRENIEDNFNNQVVWESVRAEYDYWIGKVENV
jgi:glycosyltransferase involved in cell wall biosynthesis